MCHENCHCSDFESIFCSNRLLQKCITIICLQGDIGLWNFVEANIQEQLTDELVTDYLTGRMLDDMPPPEDMSFSNLDQTLANMGLPFKKQEDNTIGDGNCFLR